MEHANSIPPEAWELIFKSGNAAVVVLGVLLLRLYERVGKLATEIAVLKALSEVQGSKNDGHKA